MNNFVFSQDPLLYTAITGRQQNQPDYELKRQLDDALAQYQAISQQAPPPQSPKNDTKDYTLLLVRRKTNARISPQMHR